jgi:hypothetical protein
MRRLSVTMTIAGLTLLVLAGCASPGTRPGSGIVDDPTAGPAFIAPSTAYALLPDGSVPWVDERLTSADLAPRSAPASPAPGDRPCRAAALTGSMSSWQRPETGGERADPDIAGKLYGWADIHNTSARECTLRGETDVRLYANGRQLPIGYSHNLNAEARARVTVLPPGGHASLRLDWTGPYCAPLPGPLELRIPVPDGGGTLRAPVTTTLAPGCFDEQTHPKLASVLSSGGFDRPTQPVEWAPIGAATARLTGPASAAPGTRITYHAVLTDPTSEPIPLADCPAYAVELLAMGSATTPAFETDTLYRLNCRPANQLPAHASLSFEMSAEIPATLASGRELTLSWGIRVAQPQALPPNSKVSAELRIRID